MNLFSSLGGYVELIHNASEDLWGLEAPVLDMLTDVAPCFAVLRLSGDTALLRFLLLIFGAVNQLEFVEVRPGVSEVGIDFYLKMGRIT